MNLDEYIACIKEGNIPPGPAKFSSHRRFDFYDARMACAERGLWIMVDQHWTRQLANWIGDRTVLEIMAGRGWLAKALAEHGVDIIATDSKEWSNQHNKCEDVHPVETLEASDAVVKHADRDILLVSWPPYGEMAVCEACEIWGPERPIIYIGEGEGGCNAPDEFFAHFRRTNGYGPIDMRQWYGLHDCVDIGYYK